MTVIEALELGIGYAKESLANHDAKFERREGRWMKESLVKEAEIQEMEKALAGLKILMADLEGQLLEGNE